MVVAELLLQQTIHANAPQGAAAIPKIMSHQRYLSHDPVKEPHSVSVKVLRYVNQIERPRVFPQASKANRCRLSRPSLVTQYPVEPPFKTSNETKPEPLEASLAYRSKADTNPSPFLLSPILNLPVSFGSAYVGETFSCTLCANNELVSGESNKSIRDVRIEAEMKTPGLGHAQRLELAPAADNRNNNDRNDDNNNDNYDNTNKTSTAASSGAVDLAAGGTLQKIVSFDLKEEGNHVLAVTVSYYEASETSGRTRTFRKLYQFICKASLIVRTKVGMLDTDAHGRRRWVLEAQLENCSEDAMQLDKVVMELEPGFRYKDCNWETSGSDKPVLHPGEVEQVCFVVEEHEVDVVTATTGADGRLVFGALGIGWKGEMGNRGFLSTGKLGTRVPR